MKRQTLYAALVVMVATLAATADVRAAERDQPVKVFILAGQSNMEGKAENTLLDHQATDPKTTDFFAHLRDGDKWAVRDDVFIKFLGRKGPLTIGYGSPGRTGAELEFGWMMGDHFEEPVLLIKAAWGGHSLYQKFRPPSAGYPSEEDLQKELEECSERVKANEREDTTATIRCRRWRTSRRATARRTATCWPRWKTLRELRDDVSLAQGQEAGDGRVLLVPGIQRPVRRQRSGRVRVQHEALHQGRAQGPEGAEHALRDRCDRHEHVEAGRR